MQAITKLDESGTHDCPYMVMAGHTARLGQWNRFDHKWRKALRKNKLEYFHSKEHRYHEFVPRGLKAISENLWFGFVVRLDEADFKKYYRDDPRWGGKAQPDSMYGLCFRYCLSFVLGIALRELPHKGLILNFVVEEGHVNSGAPAEIVRQLKRKNISGVSEYLGQAIAEPKKKIPGLQAADALATSSWHIEETPLLSLGPPVLAEHADVETRRSYGTPQYRCHINPEELGRFKEDYFAHVERRINFGRTRASLKEQSS